MDPRRNRNVRRPGRPVYGRPTNRRSSAPRFNFSLSGSRLVSIGSLILAVLIIILASRLVTLNSIAVSGNKSLSKELLTNLARNGLNQQWLGKSLLLVNTNDLSSYMTQAEPGIKDIKLHRQFPHTLKIVIIERQPSLNWSSGGQSYLLDTEGTVIGTSRAEYSNLPTVIDSTNLPVKVGDRVAPAQFVAFCTAIAAALPASKLKPVEIQVPSTTSEVYVKTDKNYIIKFDTTRPAGDELADLNKVLVQLASIKKTPAEYIDLRIEHKAYYK